jgi:hypothetical protein
MTDSDIHRQIVKERITWRPLVDRWHLKTVNYHQLNQGLLTDDLMVIRGVVSQLRKKGSNRYDFE